MKNEDINKPGSKERSRRSGSFSRLEEGRDYYTDGRSMVVFTEQFLLDRGYCCDNGCRHCPYRK